MQKLIPILIIAASLIPGAGKAQTETGADILLGRVTDMNGRPIGDAQVGVTSLQSGLRRSVTTDGEGRYKIYFPETPPRYLVLVKKLGFAPAQQTIIRHTTKPEEMTVDMKLGGTPLALSMVEIEGEAGASPRRENDSEPIAPVVFGPAGTVPNPVAEILALKDTLHLSAVQIVGLTDVSDSLLAKNARIYKDITTLLLKSKAAGNANQMAGSIAMMLVEASDNTTRAVSAAEKLLQPEQWLLLPAAIRDQAHPTEEVSKQ